MIARSTGARRMELLYTSNWYEIRLTVCLLLTLRKTPNSTSTAHRAFTGKTVCQQAASSCGMVATFAPAGSHPSACTRRTGHGWWPAAARQRRRHAQRQRGHSITAAAAPFNAGETLNLFSPSKVSALTPTPPSPSSCSAWLAQAEHQL